MKIQAYLAFNGNCQEALNFYANLFNAEIKNRQTYEEKKIDVPSSFRQKLQHAELKGKGVHFMAYDASPDTPLNNGNLFNAEIKNRQTYEEKKIDVPSSFRQKLQHAELKGKGVHFMAYDASPDTPLNNGNQINMSVDLNDLEEGKQLFKELSSGGQVHHEFREREWGHFGRCTDSFGIGWMVNVDK